MPVARSIFCALLVVLGAQTFWSHLTAREVQHHGLVFENWINDTFFNGHRPSYTGNWDIPAHINTSHGHIPINPKVAKWGSRIYLGDALRQFDIDEPFLIIIGFWEQHQHGKKKFVNITPLRIEKDQWRQLWHPLTREDLVALDTLIKDRSAHYTTVRRLARQMNARPPYNQSIVRLNPKIDPTGQRRLQCSLSFDNLKRLLPPGVSLEKNDSPSLWGETFHTD